MDSKVVSNRIREARVVASALDTHVTPQASPLETALGLGTGALAPVVVALSRTLTSRADTLDRDERALRAERADDDAPRAARNRAASELRETLFEVSDTLAGTFGSDEPTRYGLAGTTPNDPDLLIARARNTVTLLHTLAPSPAKPGRTADLAVLATELETRITPLAAALRAVATEAREEQALLVQRDASAEKLDQAYAATAAIASALLELAGQPELADRVRPTQRRRAGKTNEPAPTPGT